MDYSYKELRKCAERELGLRRVVYPRWVDSRRMSQEFAKGEIDKMQAIIEILAELEKKERLS